MVLKTVFNTFTTSIQRNLRIRLLTFTQIIHYAFLRRIQKEKKQLEIKTKIIERTGYDEVMMVDDSLLSNSSSEYNTIKDNIAYKTNRQ